MGRWVKIPRIKGVDIPWVARQNTIDRGSNTMGSGVDILCQVSDTGSPEPLVCF
jgi:hypothetical protein